MTAIPLFTSIPPSVSRRDENGNEIGAAYQESCIRSWIAAGFKPYSVNGPDDVVPFPELVEVIRVPRTAKELHGKPVVFIADLFAAAHAVTPGPVMIINADILLRPAFDLAGMVANLPPDKARIAHRIDVDRVDSTAGTPEYAGFDIFIAHAAQLARLPEAGFAVGLPWWDYYVPMALYSEGVVVRVLQDQFAYHLKHQQKWDRPSWLKFGIIYSDALSRFFTKNQAIRDQGLLDTDVAQQWRDSKRWKPIVSMSTAIHPRIGQHVEDRTNKLVRRSLGNLSRDTVAFINQNFSSSPSEISP